MLGRLVADARCTPLVIPLWHVGMDDVLPVRQPWLPRLGQKITVVFGEPLDFSEQVRRFRQEQLDAREQRLRITQQIESAARQVRDEALEIHRNRLATTD